MSALPDEARTAEQTSRTDNQRVAAVSALPPPRHLIDFFPVEGTPVEAFVLASRAAVKAILDGRDRRLLAIVGPCSIHDPDAALEYAALLAGARQRFGADLEIAMRIYFEKPRTTVGWKGLINDPFLDGSFRINQGLRIARDLLLRVNRLGVPAASEFLDTISPQYIGDLVAWGAIGARTTESQVHRELASGLSAPIGFKNGTDGSVKIAVEAMLAARGQHHFLSIDKDGRVATVRTRGNADCHLILRGGRQPNYGPADVAAACQALAAAELPERVMVDCSHANSGKDHLRQQAVADALAEQVAGGDRRIVGFMAESHLEGGRQDWTLGQTPRPRQSITDACLSWADTVPLLETLAAAVRQRR